MNSGRVLSAARRGAGMTQRELAEAAGVPQSTVGRIEANAVDPKFDTLVRLLEASGYELSLDRRLGQGIDRSLIRDRLRMSPEERIRLAVEEARAMPTITLRR